MLTGQTDRRTDGRQTVTLRFPLDTAIVKMHAIRVYNSTKQQIDLGCFYSSKLYYIILLIIGSLVVVHFANNLAVATLIISFIFVNKWQLCISKLCIRASEYSDFMAL